MSDFQSVQEPQTITPDNTDLGGINDGPDFDAAALREQALALDEDGGGDGEEQPDEVPDEADEAPEEAPELDEAAGDDEQPEETEQPEEQLAADDAQLLEDYKAWRRGDRKDDDKVFAALSRKKQEIREREMAAYHANTRAQEVYAQAQRAQQQAEATLAEYKQNPLKALEAAGYSYNDITEMVLRDGQKTPEQMKAEIREEFEKKGSEEFRQWKEQQEKHQRLVQFHGAVGQYVDQALASGQFPHAAKLEPGGIKNAVAGLIQEHWRNTGGREALDPMRALGYLEGQYKDLASRFGGSPAPESSDQPEREPGTKNPAASKPKSLTNGASASREVKRETDVPSPGASEEEWDAYKQKLREQVAASSF